MYDSPYSGVYDKCIIYAQNLDWYSKQKKENLSTIFLFISILKACHLL